LVQRAAAELPLGETLNVLGLGDSPSMLVLFYFPDPGRIRVVPQSEGIPSALPRGYYLLASSAWQSLHGSDADPPEGWQLLWSDTLRERGISIPLLFARRLE